MTDDEGDREEPVQRPDYWLPPTSAPVPPPPPPPPPAPSVPSEPKIPRAPSGPIDGLRARGGSWAQDRVRQRTVWRLLPLLLVPVLLMMSLVVSVFTGSIRSSSPAPRPATTSGPPTRPAEVVWQVDPKALRPDLPDAELVTSLDGSFEESSVAEVSATWVTISGNAKGASTVVHAIDPDDGSERWRRPLDGVLCATESASGILCASVLERDQATGLGIRWRLHLLDAQTGADRASRDIDGWLTAVHEAGGSFVVLEQREPAPHVVVSAFRSTDLSPAWTRDLAREPGQEEMFTRDRITNRPEPERPGLVLDRPRFRDVGSDLVAVWAGQQTAFIDRGSGRLVMMPHCSRLVDDGKRLWCNEVDGASAYSYAGRRLFTITGPRLAFPDGDRSGRDLNRAVLLDDDGRAVSVDPRSGKVGQPYTPPGKGSAFGQVTMPRAATVGDRTFVIGEAGTALLDAKRDGVTWLNADIKLSDLPLVVGQNVLLGVRTLDVVDLQTGTSSGRIRTERRTNLVAVGDRIAGSGSDGLSLIRVR